jgi:hypothetical protein
MSQVRGLLLAKRVWRCQDPDCPSIKFTEARDSRAVTCATDGLQRFDTSSSALARQLGVSLAYYLGRHQG